MYAKHEELYPDRPRLTGLSLRKGRAFGKELISNAALPNNAKLDQAVIDRAIAAAAQCDEEDHTAAGDVGAEPSQVCCRRVLAKTPAPAQTMLQASLRVAMAACHLLEKVSCMGMPCSTMGTWPCISLRAPVVIVSLRCAGHPGDTACRAGLCNQSSTPH